MKILVTGGAGFIGSHVVDAFVKAGHKVWVIDNESTGKKKNISKKAHFTKLDIRNSRALRAFFSAHKFDVVDHHAAQIDVRISVNDPRKDAEINLIGLLNLLEESKRTKVKKFIFSSSGGTVYGECSRAADESWPEVPLSPYGVAKLASEKYILAYNALFNLNFTIFRYANVYGPRQDPHGEAGVVAIFAKRLLQGEPCSIFGDGRQTRDYVYVKDVAKANLKALHGGKNQIINIGTSKSTSVITLYHVLAQHAQVGIKPIFKPKRLGELQRSLLDIRKAARVINWRPETTLSEGLKETLNYFKSL